MQGQDGHSVTQEGIVWAERERGVEDRVLEFIAQQDWLEPISTGLHRATAKAMKAMGPRVTDFLHGTWLRHPLHPVLTDVPLGAWTVAMVMDVAELGSEEPKLVKCTDGAVGLGIAGGLAAATAGLADWRHIDGYPRRVGMVHAALNATALALYGASLGLRLRGARKQGVALSMLGMLSATAAAWLGGHLIYTEGVGVDHTAFQEPPTDFVPVLQESALQEGHLAKAQAGGVNVLLFRRGGQIWAIAETCAHQGGPLSEGTVEDDTVICPWHGSQFRLQDGTVIHGPSAFDQPCFEVRVQKGQIEVRRAPTPR